MLARVGEDDEQSAVLRRTLSTPLMVFLAKKAYSEKWEGPADLLAPSRLRDEVGLSDFLIDKYVEVMQYYLPVRDKRINGRLLWHDTKAVRWLGCFAA